MGVNWGQQSIEIEASPEDCFEAIVDYEAFPDWQDAVLATEVLERYDDYFREDLPYLDELIFQSIGDDQAAFQALQAGQAHAYEGMTTTDIVDQAEENPDIQVTQQPAPSPYIIQLNTAKPPFDDQRVREAFYYATDTDAIRAGLFDDRYPVSQSFTGPGGLFHQEEVEGYRTHDPEMAQEIVEEVGGISLTLATIQNPIAEQINTALQTQWLEAGMDVQLDSWELAQGIEAFEAGDWDAMLQTVGSWDPHAGIGLPARFQSTSAITGVWDDHLDQLIRAGGATVDPDEREEIYLEAGEYISDNAYAPIMFAFAPANVATEGVNGMGLTTEVPPLLVNSGVIWDTVWMEDSAQQ
jgi:peptide/nickel transport system substrate-binding protein